VLHGIENFCEGAQSVLVRLLATRRVVVMAVHYWISGRYDGNHVSCLCSWRDPLERMLLLIFLAWHSSDANFLLRGLSLRISKALRASRDTEAMQDSNA